MGKCLVQRWIEDPKALDTAEILLHKNYGNRVTAVTIMFIEKWACQDNLRKTARIISRNSWIVGWTSCSIWRQHQSLRILTHNLMLILLINSTANVMRFALFVGKYTIIL